METLGILILVENTDFNDMSNDSIEPIKHYQELNLYQKAVEAAMQIFELSKRFPLEERDTLIEPIRRSSRSVCSNLAKAWHKRRYKADFMATLTDSQAEAAETQTWIEFAVKSNYLNVETGRELYKTYNCILKILLKLVQNCQQWTGVRRLPPHYS